MRFISSRLIKPAIKGKDGKYIVAVEVTDKDIAHFEDMAMCYMVNGRKPKSTLFKKEYGQQYDESHDLTPEYSRFTRKLWAVFHKPWKLYDVCGCDAPGDFREFIDLAYKYRDELNFTSSWHRCDKGVLDEIKRAEAERKAKLPPEKPWVEDPVAKEQHRILKKHIPKDITYTMHFEGNKIMGPIDEVSFFYKRNLWCKPTVVVKKEKEQWITREIFYFLGNFTLKVSRKRGSFEECVKKAIEVMKNAK